MSYEKEKTPHWAESLKPSPLAERLLRKLPSSGNYILEIGVGNGRDSIYFAENGNKVEGIDIAQGAVNLAKENAEKKGVKGVNFEIGDAEKLKFKDDTFDAVLSIAVLHSTILSESIKEIARVLKSEGKGMIHLYSKIKSKERVYHLILTSEEAKQMKPQDKVKKILEENGFVVEDIYTNIDEKHEGEITEIVVAEFHKRGEQITEKLD